MSTAPISEQEPKVTPSPAKPREPELSPEPSSGFGFRKWLVLLIILGVVGAAVWKIRKNTEEQGKQDRKMAAMLDRATPVQTVNVQQKTMPIFLTQLGTVTAYNTVTIKSRVDGQLIRVNVHEGQKVSKGQLLAEIDPAPYQAALAQAQGQLARDQAQHANDQAQSTRYGALFQAGVVSRESAQTQESAAGQSAGAILADQASIQAAKVNLNYTKITSPIDGVVGLRQVDPGNIVHASDTTGLLVVTQLQPITVIFTLPEDHLPEVLGLMRKGRTLTVEAYDRAGIDKLAVGKVLTVDNQIDTTTGTVKVKAIFDNTDGALFPNQFVNIRLILEERPNAIVIPSAALLSGSSGNFVYVVKSGEPPAELQTVRPEVSDGPAKGQAASSGEAAAAADLHKDQPKFYAETRTVKVDLTEGTQIILASGLKAGESIVIDGQEKLRNGSRVIPRKAENPNGPRAVDPNRAATGVKTSETPENVQPKVRGGVQQP